jgi:hypothetical protein
MSAVIVVHPRNYARLWDLCRRFQQLGYALSNTRSGYIVARPIPPRLTTVVELKRPR